MRKYSLADGYKRSTVDLRDYKDVIIGAVKEFSPENIVIVEKSYYLVKKPISHSEAVRVGRRICESDLSQHCIKLSKLFNSTVVKEKTDENRKEQKRPGGHH